MSGKTIMVLVCLAALASLAQGITIVPTLVSSPPTSTSITNACNTCMNKCLLACLNVGTILSLALRILLLISVVVLIANIISLAVGLIVTVSLQGIVVGVLNGCLIGLVLCVQTAINVSIPSTNITKMDCINTCGKTLADYKTYCAGITNPVCQPLINACINILGTTVTACLAVL